MSGSKIGIHVCGWTGCKWYQRAAHMAETLSVLYPAKYVAELHASESRDAYRAVLDTHRAAVPSSAAAQKHTASPFVYKSLDGVNAFVGGCDASVEWARGVLGDGGGGEAAASAEMLDDGFAKDHGYDYDVVVIGGGSGGLSCSKRCAANGAKVACLDFVKPSPAGSAWGLGGTCVNVGCIPKKLMHTASIVGESIRDDAAAFGWTASARGDHDWGAMRSNVQNYVKSLNFKYRVALREAGVTYLNRLGSFSDAHTLELKDKKGNVSSVTAARFIVAVGGRPNKLGCPGGEHAVDSDDVFSLERAPGRVLCVGAGYIALECGGFLAGMGYPVTCMVRSILLRGFDRECVGKIEAHLLQHGISLDVGVTPAKIEKNADGSLTVTDSAGKASVYDTVLVATGRTADTAALGVANVPGAEKDVDAKGKLVAENEQLPHAPHVYAIGDVLADRPELTPVAIEAGLRLADRLFKSCGGGERMDYENVATTIFTPLEYGVIGLSEEDAEATLGKENVEAYISEFSPLEHALSEARELRGAAEQAFAKVIVDKASGGKVVGFHYLGPNAGEITQGFAVAMRKGATYADFASTVGIHPTVAEEFTTISVTKSSGDSAAKGGC